MSTKSKSPETLWRFRPLTKSETKVKQNLDKSETKVKQDFWKILANLTNDETEVFPENLTLARLTFKGGGVVICSAPGTSKDR